MTSPEEQDKLVEAARQVLERETSFTVIEREKLAWLRKVEDALNQVRLWASPDAAVRMYLPKRTLKSLDEVRRKIESELS